MAKQKQQKHPGRNYLKRRHEEQQKVTEPLTPKGVRRETRAATNLRFKPLEKAVAGDLRASERRVKDEGDWWQNYLSTVNQGQADTSAAYAQAAATNQAQIGQASAVDSANTAQLQAEGAKSAELRGAAPSTAPAEREVAAQAQRNYLAAAQGGATAQMGANQRGYLSEQKRIGVGQSIASRQAEQRRGQSIRQDRRDVRKERGDYAATKRGELRDKERDYLIQNRAFPLEKRKAANEEREGSRDAAESRRKAGLEAEDNRRQNEEQRNENKKTKREGKKGGSTPAEQREAKEGRQNALATVNSFIQAHGYPKNAGARAELEREVAKESEVSPSQARWAVSTYLKRHPKKASPAQGEVHR
jgi:hypothetical protein